MTESEASNANLMPPLYAHRKGDDWGLAILAWERGSRRGYQFEDGQLRIFKEGYYDLLDEVDTPNDRAVRVIAELQRKLGTTLDGDAAAPKTSRKGPDITFEQQMQVLTTKYPLGFADPAWIAAHRGDPSAKRSLKRHRARPIEVAREAFSVAALDAALEQGRASDIHAAALELLETTDLVSKKQLEPLRMLAASSHGAFASRLRDLLYGDDAYELRFERYVATLALVRAGEPSWQLVTALPSLVLPNQHVCVRPATLRKQAEWMAPRLRFNKTPNGTLCARFNEMTIAARQELLEAGHEAADLLDVFDFMLETLKPSAKQLLMH